MFKNFISFALIFFFFSCEDSKSDASSSSKAEDAFSKIDKKSESLFTKQDRVNNYKKSIAKAESLNKSLKDNANYSGYGATAVNKKNSKTKKEKIKKENLSKKKVNYGSKSINSQVYSAYSTN